MSGQFCTLTMFCPCHWQSSIYNIHDISHGASNTKEYSIRSPWTPFCHFLHSQGLRNANVICIKIFARNPFPRNIVKLVASSTSVASSQSFVVGQPLPLPLPPPDSLNTDCGWHYNLLCLVWGELVIIVIVISIIIIAISIIIIVITIIFFIRLPILPNRSSLYPQLLCNRQSSWSSRSSFRFSSLGAIYKLRG